MNTLIKQYDNVFSDEHCDYCIDLFESHKEDTYQGITMKGFDPKFKKSQDLNLLKLSSIVPEFEDDKSLPSYEHHVDKIILPEIYQGIKDCLIKYMRTCMPVPVRPEANLEGMSDEEVWHLFYSSLSEDKSSILLKHYEKNDGRYNWHVDVGSGSWRSNSRMLVTMWYLNDVEEGGETEFKHQDVSIKPKKGSVVIFPAFATHLHRGKMPLSGDKYIGNMWWVGNNPAVQEELMQYPRHWSAKTILNYGNPNNTK